MGKFERHACVMQSYPVYTIPDGICWMEETGVGVVL
jgi:hypothetical protein